MKTEPMFGFGLKVGGPRPYLAECFSQEKSGITCTEPYHHPVRVVLITAYEYEYLKRLEDGKDVS